MNILPSSTTRKMSQVVLKAKKHSPNIFFAGGLIGVVTSTVLACRATLNLHYTLDSIQEEIESVKVKHMALISKSGDQVQAEKDFHRELSTVYALGAYRITKLYAPSIMLGSISIAALTGSHVALTRRNAALSAAYAAVTRAYDEYRSRVREEVGDEREKELYYNVEACEIESTEGLAPGFNVKTGAGSPYARMFDPSCHDWQEAPEYNRMFLLGKQRYLQNLLQSRGHVMLNEAYEALGMPCTKEGALVGWMYKNPRGGDGYIDFGLFNQERNIQFQVGGEPCVLIDFNVDGVVYDLL